VTAAAAILRGRAAAERLMQDTCVISRVTGQTTNQDTGVVTSTTTTVYAGKCRLQQQAPGTTPEIVGEASLWPQTMVLQLPMVVTGLQPDDIVTCTASALDPDLIGRKWHLRGVAHKTHLTARRHQLQEIVA
jgi:hypothetical protein